MILAFLEKDLDYRIAKKLVDHFDLWTIGSCESCEKEIYTTLVQNILTRVHSNTVSHLFSVPDLPKYRLIVSFVFAVLSQPKLNILVDP